MSAFPNLKDSEKAFADAAKVLGLQQPPIVTDFETHVSVQREKFDVKTCVTCTHKVKGDTHALYCGKARNAVTGATAQRCDTERMLWAADPTQAQATAELHNLCGPNGDFWEESPVITKRWWQKLIPA